MSTMSQPSLPPRPLSLVPHQPDGVRDMPIPRRPVGASLSNRSSQQSTENLRLSAGSTRVDFTSPLQSQVGSPNLFEPGNNDGNEQEALTDESSMGKTRAGYEELLQYPSPYEPSFHHRQKPCRDSSFYPRQDKHRNSCMYHLKAWGPEVAWCALALVLLLAIAGILNHYKERTEKKWFNGELTLNAVVAFVATLCRASMVIPIAECISQLKWNSFASGKRPLKDLYAFDQASRGPYGSMVLLFKTSGRLLGVVTVAALVVVSSLVTSPMTQATIDYHAPKQFENHLANVTRPIALDSFPAGVKEDMKRAALRSMFTENFEPEPFKPEPHCPTSKCEWAWFEALDICTTTDNLTKDIEYSPTDYATYKDLYKTENPDGISGANHETKYTKISFRDIPNAVWVKATATATRFLLYLSGPQIAKGGNTRELLAPWDRGNISHFSDVFLGSLVLTYVPPYAPNFADTGQIEMLEAIQVTWHWCVKNYTIGKNATTDYVDASVSKEQIPRRFSPYKTQLQPDKKVSRVPGYSEDFIGEALSGGQGSTRGPSNEIRHQMWRIFYPETDLEGEETEDAVLTTDPNDYMKNKTHYSVLIEEMANAVAMSMGNVIRQLGNDGENGPSTNELRNATTTADNPVLRIRWRWLSLLATQVLFTILFLLYVAINTAIMDVEIVKSSNIAELLALHQRGDESHDAVSIDGRSLPPGIYPSLEDDVFGKLKRQKGFSQGWVLELDSEVPSSKRDRWSTVRKSLSGLFKF